MKTNPINPELPQPCMYCDIGTYKKVSEFYPGAAAASMNSRFREEFNYFGITPHSDGEAIWLIMICNHYGNVQFFRPDYFAGKRNSASKNLPSTKRLRLY